MKYIQYEGYTGTVEIDEDDNSLHGEVVGLTDMIAYEGKTPQALVKSFRAAVDEYLSFCAERGEEPEKPFSGRFVVRISPELHCAAAQAARDSDQSMNMWVKGAIESAVEAYRRAPISRSTTQSEAEKPKKTFFPRRRVAKTRR